MPSSTMTQEAFDELRPDLGRLSVATMDVARLVLVEGMSQSDAGARFGMSRQRVYGIMQRFQAAMRILPTTWRKVEVWLPPELAAEVEAKSKAAIAEHHASKVLNKS